ncbi:MAG: HAD hydrolase family protein [Gemmatimonadota bacterium]|nr:HAD hydrolase family protein [Gemmatimonadota bacterium]
MLPDPSLFISDLDGTLLDSATTLSRYSRDTLNTLIDQGLLFTVASARSIASMRHVLAGLRLCLPVVEVNGAFVSDLAVGRHYVVHELHRDILPGLWQLIARSGHMPFISTYDGNADRCYYRDITNGGMAWYVRNRKLNQDPRMRYLHDLERGLEEQVVSLRVIGTGPEMEKLADEMSQPFAGRIQTQCFENLPSPGWHWLTIQDAGATKEAGIRYVQRMKGLEDRRLVVFGDEKNDLGMFKLADEALAVANALPDLKERATGIIDSNEEDGVAKYIRHSWYGTRE